jgi:hypothetical protein
MLMTMGTMMTTIIHGDGDINDGDIDDGHDDINADDIEADGNLISY